MGLGRHRHPRRAWHGDFLCARHFKRLLAVNSLVVVVVDIDNFHGLSQMKEFLLLVKFTGQTLFFQILNQVWVEREYLHCYRAK